MRRLATRGSRPARGRLRRRQLVDDGRRHREAATRTSNTGSLEADFAISAQGLSGKGSGVFNNGSPPAS